MWPKIKSPSKLSNIRSISINQQETSASLLAHFILFTILPEIHDGSLIPEKYPCMNLKMKLSTTMNKFFQLEYNHGYYGWDKTQNELLSSAIQFFLLNKHQIDQFGGSQRFFNCESSSQLVNYRLLRFLRQKLATQMKTKQLCLLSITGVLSFLCT